mgnify:CR=1 FL=1
MEVFKPVGVAVDELEEPRRFDEGHRLRRVGKGRPGEEDAPVIMAQLKCGCDRRAVCERAAEEIIYAAAVVNDDGIAAGEEEQLLLVFIVLGVHHGARDVYREGLARYRHAFVHHAAHLRLPAPGDPGRPAGKGRAAGQDAYARALAHVDERQSQGYDGKPAAGQGLRPGRNGILNM